MIRESKEIQEESIVVLNRRSIRKKKERKERKKERNRQEKEELEIVE